jgi:DNA-binding response OmpR family regulator
MKILIPQLHCAVANRSGVLLWKFTQGDDEVLARHLRHRGKLVGREELLKEVWGPAHAKETRYLRVYLAQLRRKLEDDPSHPVHLLTESGMGYRFQQ